MVIDKDCKCTACGTLRGIMNPITGKPWRNKNGWCKPCCSRGGKPNSQGPCIDCGTLGGDRRTSKSGNYLIRVKGRCKSCYTKMYRKMEREWCKPLDANGPGKKELVNINKFVFGTAIAKPEEKYSVAKKNRIVAQAIEEACRPTPVRETDMEHERRVMIQRCIQDYRSAWKKCKAIKKYKLDVVKETESVLLSA